LLVIAAAVVVVHPQLPLKHISVHLCTGTLYARLVVFFVPLVYFPGFKFEVYFICKQIFHFWKHILLCLSLLEYTEQTSLFSANECLFYKITTNFWFVNMYCLSYLIIYTLTQFIHYIVHHHQLWGYLLPWFLLTHQMFFTFLPTEKTEVFYQSTVIETFHHLPHHFVLLYLIILTICLILC
jgi:hypothetical protein